MRMQWIVSLGLLLAAALAVRAQPPADDFDLPPLRVPGPPVATAAGSSPAATLEAPRPAATLEAPRPLVVRAQAPESRARPAPSRSLPSNDDPLLGPVGVGMTAPVPMTRGMTPFGQPMDEELYNSGVVTAPIRPVSHHRKHPLDPRRTDDDTWWEQRSAFGGANNWLQPGAPGGTWFQSDNCFDKFISPVTNPFLAEDPRSLTEIRPVFLYQAIGNSAPTFNGGNAFFFGARGSLAFTDRLSLTVNKLGALGLYPADGSPIGDEFGFAEIWLGPKYTFIRNPDSQTLLAGGAIFQIPAGSNNVFQNTGDLSIAPYVSFAQHLGFLPNRFGGFNFMNTLGFSFSIDDQRSNYFYNSAHLDYDLAGLNKFFPLIELNWFHYTRSGDASFIGLEGADLVNFGSSGIAGRDYLLFAVGARYKFTEQMQMGAAAEFPLIGPPDLNRFRLTVDFILRF